MPSAVLERSKLVFASVRGSLQCEPSMVNVDDFVSASLRFDEGCILLQIWVIPGSESIQIYLDNVGLIEKHLVGLLTPISHDVSEELQHFAKRRITASESHGANSRRARSSSNLALGNTP